MNDSEDIIIVPNPDFHSFTVLNINVHFNTSFLSLKHLTFGCFCYFDECINADMILKNLYSYLVKNIHDSKFLFIFFNSASSN